MSNNNSKGEEDPFEDDHIPSPGRNDDDFNSSDAKNEVSQSGSDWDSELSDSEDRRRKREERWNRSTPEGARRSKRKRGGDDTNDDDDDEGTSNKHTTANGSTRPTRSLTTGASNGMTTTTANNNTNSDENNDDSDGNAAEYLSPSNIVLKRDVPPEQIDDIIQEIREMWEMAAVLDFFHLFRRQLNFQRQFTADELERVLVTSVGDEGLLADVHIDIMKGISPKNVINTSNWQVHLANKIKFHWRNLSDGTPCPFKPEKYYESMTYAELPAAQRVRALHFICCVRCDREDIQARIFKSEQPKTKEQIEEAEAAVEAARQRAQRGTRSAKVAEEPDTSALETLEAFRREPTGVDSSGIAYYYYDMVETYGFRLYREIPLSRVSLGSKRSTAAKIGSQLGGKENDDNDDNDNGDDDDEDDNDEDDGDGADGDKQQQAAANAKSINDAKMSKKQRERALRKMPLIKGKSQIKDHPPPDKWELAASTVDELQAIGERLNRSMKPADKSLGHLFLEELIPQLQEKAEAEERRRRAAERVRSRLGMEVNTDELVVGGRSRRERRQVNYAFTDYDDMLRSAIRRSQRRDDSPADWEDGPRRSGRHSSPAYMYDDIEAARAGMRRGRSAAALKAEEGAMMNELDERALRQLAKKRKEYGGSVEDDDEQQGDDDVEQHGNGDGDDDYEQQQQPLQQQQDEAPKKRRGRPRGSTNQKYKDYVADFEEEFVNDDEDDGEARYIPRPSKKRGGVGGSVGGGGGDVQQQQQRDEKQAAAVAGVAMHAQPQQPSSHTIAATTNTMNNAQDAAFMMQQQQQYQYQQAMMMYQQQLLLQQQQQQQQQQPGMFNHAMYSNGMMPMQPPQQHSIQQQQHQQQQQYPGAFGGGYDNNNNNTQQYYNNQ